MKKLQLCDIVAIILFVIVEGVILFDNLYSLTLWQNKMLQRLVITIFVLGHYIIYALVKKRELLYTLLIYWIAACIFNVSSLLWVYLPQGLRFPFALIKEVMRRSIGYFLPTSSTIPSNTQLNILNVHVPDGTIFLLIIICLYILLYAAKIKRNKM